MNVGYLQHDNSALPSEDKKTRLRSGSLIFIKVFCMLIVGVHLCSSFKKKDKCLTGSLPLWNLYFWSVLFMRAVCKGDAPPLASGMTAMGYMKLVKRKVVSNTKELDLTCS